MKNRKYATAKNTKIFEATIARKNNTNIDLRVVADSWSQAEIVIGLWLQKEQIIDARVSHLQEMFYSQVVTLTIETETV